MSLYDPSLAVQAYGQGLQQANANQMAIAQAPTPAQVFLDRLRQSKQDQLQQDQFDWQKQYQGGMLQNTAERNAAWAENNKLKNILTNQGQQIRLQLGQEANRLRNEAVRLKEQHQNEIDPARKALLEEQARNYGLKADQLEQLTQMPDDGSGSIYQRMQEATIAAKEGIPALQQSQIWRNYNPTQMQGFGIGGQNVPLAMLPVIERRSAELAKANEQRAREWDAANKTKNLLKGVQGQAPDENPYRKPGASYWQQALQEMGFQGVPDINAPYSPSLPQGAPRPAPNVQQPGSSGTRVKAVSKGVPAPQPSAGSDGIVTIKDDSEYNALKPGTKYKGPDGVVRIK